MNRIFIGIALFVGLGTLAFADTQPVYDIPLLDNIVIDGKADDWGDRGFRVNVLGDANGNLKPASDLDAPFRLGWDDRGLLLLLKVTDNVAEEAPGEFWTKDSVELFFAPKRGASDLFQLVVSPGVDPHYPELRTITNFVRVSEGLRQVKPSFSAVRTKTADGYILEVLFPWENFAYKPAVGSEFAFQIYVNDTDNGPKTQALWYPESGAINDSSLMQRLRLSDHASPPIDASVSGDYERLHRITIAVAATGALANQTVTVKDGTATLASAPLASKDGRATAKLVLPMPPDDKPYGPLAVTVGDQLLKTLDLPSPKALRAAEFMKQDFNFTPNVFGTAAFPSCDFDQPNYVEDLIGPYTISTTFYDAAYNKVTTAEKPGRYGAVVEIKTADGKTYRRLRTLFRTPQRFSWWNQSCPASFDFPAGTGIDPAVSTKQKAAVSRYLSELVGDSTYGDKWTHSWSPALMAFLYETKASAPEAGVYDGFYVRDRQWWVTLKRKLDGADKLWPDPIIAPQNLPHAIAPVLRTGTLKEAGMKPDAAEKIDAVLRKWAADTDEAFSVCIARHGVIVLHKAYGMRDGKPLTVDTPCRMASNTKTFSGTSMMMLVNLGLISLDDPVSKYLPSFQGITVPKTLTIRHLYTHTAGLHEHWGDTLIDFDDIVAGYYPYLEVGKRFEYNGADLALGSKIIERISGEALPLFYKHHLFDPLGMSHTTATDSFGDAYSTPMDMARLAQMLLNKGSYGNEQFMKPEVFQQMLPEPLTKELGPDSTTEWGIGLIWEKGEGLAAGTVGHGAASGATLRIDPGDDLVVIMTRNNWGKNLTVYHPQFISAIVEGIAR